MLHPSDLTPGALARCMVEALRGPAPEPERVLDFGGLDSLAQFITGSTQPDQKFPTEQGAAVESVR